MDPFRGPVSCPGCPSQPPWHLRREAKPSPVRKRSRVVAKEESSPACCGREEMSGGEERRCKEEERHHGTDNITDLRQVSCSVKPSSSRSSSYFLDL
ncbi:hypothetical protein Bca52824_011490 [Brassica carinata]|uniref:Uncharacterized protein n=1 Tax=Brassica carinata TaxID=52824 RepID=A0A8X8BBQ0_BRACI|nr:hypothetical protein Bca52824_011490 [Brassica carinata]